MTQRAKLAFELGFNWHTQPVVSVRDGVYPLQLNLVNDSMSPKAGGLLISAGNPKHLHTACDLEFRVYDFSDWSAEPTADKPRPISLQVLFTSAVGEGENFSPVVVEPKDSSTMVPTLVSTIFKPSTVPSVSYGIGSGWSAVWPGDRSLVHISNAGRFKFRALLTVGPLNDMARFYRVDPEMVVGDSETGDDTYVEAARSGG